MLQVVQPNQQEGNRPFPNATYNDDVFQGWFGIGPQIDGLGHLGGPDGTYYNCNHASDFAGITGLTKLGIEKVPPIVARGIVLDMAGHFGVESMEAGQYFTVEDVEAVQEKQGTPVREGDVVLFHTGWTDAKLTAEPEVWVAAEPGQTEEVAQYMADKNVVAVGADTWGLDVVPSPDPARPFQGHVILLKENGIYILETMNTGPLVRDGRVRVPVRARPGQGARRGADDHQTPSPFGKGRRSGHERWAPSIGTSRWSRSRPPLVATLHGVDLARPLSDDAFEEVHAAWMAHQVIFLRDQHISPEQHLAFGRRFGELHIHPAAPYAHGNPELMMIHTDKGSFRQNGAGWHSDVSADEEPPLGSILHLETVPQHGGDTLFASMYEAYDTLSEPMRTLLDGLTARHESDYTGQYGDHKPQREFPKASHPVIRTHPVTGRKATVRQRRLHPPHRGGCHARKAAPCSISCSSTSRTRRSSAASSGSPTPSPCGTTAASNTSPSGTTTRKREAASA